MAATAAPELGTWELRSLVFFHQVVAPALSGPLDSSFWTNKVVRVVYSEPAVKHAVLSISSLYEKFSVQQMELESEPVHDGNDFAIQHYNKAIKHIILPREASLDTVLLVCILFVCIESLRGNTQTAITHVSHGISLLNSSQAKSELVSVFCHLGVFPHFFGGGDVSTIPVIDTKYLAYEGYFTDLSQAQEPLDSLLLRSVRLVRMTDHHRFGIGPELQPLASAILDQRLLDVDLEKWWSAFSGFRDGFQTGTKHEVTLLLLEMRWLVAKVWTNTCLNSDETVYDSHLDKFNRIIELAKHAQVIGNFDTAKSTKFSFVMGFSPLLHFVVLKCRYLKLRLDALTLMTTLSCPRETLWDSDTMQAIGTRITEIKHGIEVTPHETTRLQGTEESELALPADRQRIIDSALEAAIEVSTHTDGRKIMRRRIRILVQGCSGGIETLRDWVTMG